MEDLWKGILDEARAGRDVRAGLDRVRAAALKDRVPSAIRFGTSGWRGLIGVDFTLFNLQRLTRAIIDMYREDLRELGEYLGVYSFEDFRRRGVLLGHDTRFLGYEFAEGAARELRRAGVRTIYAGVATTPEFSAGVVKEGYACSINLTPSHNPGCYGGYKFNPADGGPAGVQITRRIEERVAAIADFESAEKPAKWEKVDLLRSYLAFLQAGSLVDLKYCRELAHSGRVALAADSMFGATRGKMSRILAAPHGLAVFKDGEEPIFRGLSPEPSWENMGELRAAMESASAPLHLGAIWDPDGDRVQFFDGVTHVDMNRFGAAAFHYLAATRELPGGVARSVATSDFTDAVAASLGRKVYETPVGFKNFRPYLQKGSRTPALVAFEESDGISGFGHTLEKDGLLGFLLALEMTGREEKGIGAIVETLQAGLGRRCPIRRGFEIQRGLEGESTARAVQVLATRFAVGQSLCEDGSLGRIASILTTDGIKVRLEDGSWFLIRPSGTEPKVRVYAESDAPERSQALYCLGRKFFDEALGETMGA